MEKFNPADYGSDELDILDHQEIRNVSYKYRPTTKEELQMIIDKKMKKNETCIDVSDIDVSNITDMSRLFQNTDLVYINLSGWNTSNVTNMMGMFQSCQ
jgi:surface protein